LNLHLFELLAAETNHFPSLPTTAEQNMVSEKSQQSREQVGRTDFLFLVLFKDDCPMLVDDPFAITGNLLLELPIFLPADCPCSLSSNL
jgi:hypothetical protein